MFEKWFFLLSTKWMGLLLKVGEVGNSWPSLDAFKSRRTQFRLHNNKRSTLMPFTQRRLIFIEYSFFNHKNWSRDEERMKSITNNKRRSIKKSTHRNGKKGKKKEIIWMWNIFFNPFLNPVHIAISSLLSSSLPCASHFSSPFFQFSSSQPSLNPPPFPPFVCM